MTYLTNEQAITAFKNLADVVELISLDSARSILDESSTPILLMLATNDGASLYNEIVYLRDRLLSYNSDAYYLMNQNGVRNEVRQKLAQVVQ
jgi:hypothetical protein